MRVCVLSCFSPVQLCDPVDYSPLGYSANRNFQVRTLDWLPPPSPGDSPDPGMEPRPLTSPESAGSFPSLAPPGKPVFSYNIRYYDHSHFSVSVVCQAEEFPLGSQFA